MRGIMCAVIDKCCCLHTVGTLSVRLPTRVSLMAVLALALPHLAQIFVARRAFAEMLGFLNLPLIEIGAFV